MKLFQYIYRLTSRDPIITLLSNWEHNNIDERTNMLPSEKLCEMLNLHRKQKRMCRRGPGIVEALLEAIRISVIECHYQFRYERWNCSLADPYRQKILQKGNSFFFFFFSCMYQLLFWVFFGFFVFCKTSVSATNERKYAHYFKRDDYL